MFRACRYESRGSTGGHNYGKFAASHDFTVVEIAVLIRDDGSATQNHIFRVLTASPEKQASTAIFPQNRLRRKGSIATESLSAEIDGILGKNDTYLPIGSGPHTMRIGQGNRC